jgi:hypothetical protein
VPEEKVEDTFMPTEEMRFQLFFKYIPNPKTIKTMLDKCMDKAHSKQVAEEQREEEIRKAKEAVILKE